MRHLEIESRANPWKGLMLPLHQWRALLTWLSKYMISKILYLQSTTHHHMPSLHPSHSHVPCPLKPVGAITAGDADHMQLHHPLVAAPNYTYSFLPT